MLREKTFTDSTDFRRALNDRNEHIFISRTKPPKQRLVWLSKPAEHILSLGYKFLPVSLSLRTYRIASNQLA